MRPKIIPFLLCVCLNFSIYAQNSISKLSWWEAARFGMFIHWGVYSAFEGEYNGINTKGENISFQVEPGTVGAEWILRKASIPRAEYKKYAALFTAENYDPESWVQLAKKAGMKYIIITAKHHEGFCLFDTKATTWNALNSAANRDLLKPLVDAAKREGIRIGFYFSQNVDWMHGGFGYIPEIDGYATQAELEDYVVNKTLPMIKELLTNYGDIDVLWWDIPYENNDVVLAQKMYDEAIKWGGEDLITNDRLAPGFSGDYTTPEQYVPDNLSSCFEVCMTLNTTWGYNPFDHYWKSPLKILYHLSNIASKGGNYLLNIGPKADGSLPEETISILTEVGDWMAVNGEAIHGTQRRPTVYNMPFGVCTQKQENGTNKIYLHVYLWKGKELFLPGILNNAKAFEARILGYDGDVKIENFSNGILLSNLPEEAPYLLCTVIELSTKESLQLRESMYIGENINESGSTRIPAIYARTEKVPNYDFSLEIPRAFWQEVRNESKVIFPFTARTSGTYNIYANTAGDIGNVEIFINDKKINSMELPQTEKYDFQRRLLGCVYLAAEESPSTLSLSFSFDDANKLNNLASVEFDYVSPSANGACLTEDVTIYPNPAQNIIQLSHLFEGSFFIYDLKGRVVFSDKLREGYDISFLQPGMYFVKVQTLEGNSYHQKLLKY